MLISQRQSLRRSADYSVLAVPWRDRVISGGNGAGADFFSMPRVSMNFTTSAMPARVLRLVITNGLRPWALVRMHLVSACITSRLAPTWGPQAGR
jgi:hypothetical protein